MVAFHCYVGLPECNSPMNQIIFTSPSLRMDVDKTPDSKNPPLRLVDSVELEAEKGEHNLRDQGEPYRNHWDGTLAV